MSMNTLVTNALVFFSLAVSSICTANELKVNTASIASVHQQYQQKTLTSAQLVQYYLHRISTFDDNGIELNAVVQLNSQALSDARALDKHYLKHGLVGPLHGIPVLLKDNIDTKDGMANTAGSIALRDNIPTTEAFLVTQLKQAGAIILGKTNLSEWANFRSTHAASGWSGLYGQTKNPYDLTASPCGSSSGSAVAVAADLAMLAVGTETDGSVTCPASVNGIVGIKPTLGTVSRTGIIPIAHSQDTAGPMARNVTDAVMLLTAMVGLDDTDPGAITTKIDYRSHLSATGVQAKRIGVVRNLTGYLPQVDALFEQAIKDLQQAGAIIVDNTNIATLGQWDDAEYQVLLYEFKSDLAQYLASTGPKIAKSLAQLIEFNRRHAAQEMGYFGQEIFELAQQTTDLTDEVYLTALATAKQKAQQGIDKLLAEHKLDLLIAPTSQPAWKIDWLNGDHYLGSASSPAAVAGYPHITVPMGFIHGLPIGLSMFAGKLQEGVLIETAFGYEQTTQHRVAPTLSR
jgi:amidase